MRKEENDRYTYAMFNEVLPLALSISSMHTKVAPNLLRNSEFDNGRYHIVGLLIIATNFQSFLS